MTSRIRGLLSRHPHHPSKRHSSYHDGDLPGLAPPVPSLDSGDLDIPIAAYPQGISVPFIVVSSPVTFQLEHFEPVSPSFITSVTSDNNDDEDFVAWLHINNELQLNKEVAAHIDPHVRKRYLQYLNQLRALNGRSRSASTLGLSAVGNARGSNTSLTMSSSYSSDSTSGRHSTGPVRKIVHVLHLDILDRKNQRVVKKKEERLRKERMDMEKWEKGLRAQHEIEVRAENADLGSVSRT